MKRTVGYTFRAGAGTTRCLPRERKRIRILPGMRGWQDTDEKIGLCRMPFSYYADLFLSQCIPWGGRAHIHARMGTTASHLEGTTSTGGKHACRSHKEPRVQSLGGGLQSQKMQNCRTLPDITQFFIPLHLLAFKKTLDNFLHLCRAVVELRRIDRHCDKF